MLVVAVFSMPILVHANELQNLLNQQQQLQQQIDAKNQQATDAQNQATDAQNQANALGASAASLEDQLAQTSAQMNEVVKTISEKEAAIAQKKTEFDQQKAQQDEVVRILYESSDQDPVIAALGSNSVSDVIQQNQFLSSIEARVQISIDEVNAAKAQLEQEQQSLKEQQDALSSLKAKQESQRVQLVVQQQSALADAAQAAVEQQSAQHESEALKAQVTNIQNRLNVLTARARWGADIVSSTPSAGWSYIQLNYRNRMGASPFTIHDYGCLITSIAMVSTYYGHATTPPAIASHTNFFDYNGNAYVSTIVSSLGLYESQRGTVNWNTIDHELSLGHPVIVSVYLPQVGAVNSDGSSHFVVLRAKAGNTYLMEDPLGPGRGYSTNQIRSMRIIRPM